MRFLAIQPLTPDLLPAVLELDRLSLGEFWSADGYLRELESPNSDLLILREVEHGSQEPGGEGDIQHSTFGSADSPEAKIQHSLTPQSPIPLSCTPNPPPLTPLLLALGCSWSILEEAHITLMAVHPAYQRQGLGQAMLFALLGAAYKRQLERATLEVKVSNQAAIALYDKFGFKVAGRRKRYYQDTGEDALVMWRGGLHHSDFPETLNQWRNQVSDRLHQVGWQLLQPESNHSNFLDSSISCN